MTRCPDCAGRLFMRATRVIEVRVRSGLMAWLLGPVAEVPSGINAACANPECGCVVRIDRDGIARLRRKAPEMPQDRVPADVEPKPQMALNATPGHQWSRGGR